MAELYCDICGGAPVRAQILIEGAKLLACARCMRGGKVIFRFEEEGALPSLSGASAAESSEEIVEDYAKIIRNARERIKLPLSVVAERINEQESYLHALEGGRLAPTMEVAKKLEKELGIRLVEKVAGVAPSLAASGSRSFSEPTLADMLDKKKKGK